MSKRRKPFSQSIPLFIEKLQSMLEVNELVSQDENCNEFIEWTSADDSFNIKDINRFTEIVLPKYFKHSNFSSFIRQLNMYGFRKIRHEEGQNVYTHQNFKRDQKELLQQIKRKMSPSENQDQIVVYSENKQFSNSLNELKSKQKNLEGICSQLISQNSKILEDNDQMMRKLSADRKEKNKKMEQLLISLIMSRGNNELLLPDSEGSRMVTLANQSRPDYGYETYENFHEFLEKTQGMDRLEQAIKNYQSEAKKKNREDSAKILRNESESSEREGLERRVSQNENSLLSLGDFLNFEEPKDGKF